MTQADKTILRTHSVCRDAQKGSLLPGRMSALLIFFSAAMLTQAGQSDGRVNRHLHFTPPPFTLTSTETSAPLTDSSDLVARGCSSPEWVSSTQKSCHISQKVILETDRFDVVYFRSALGSQSRDDTVGASAPSLSFQSFI